MAHLFRKLRLDTQSSRPIHSPFAAIRDDGSEHHVSSRNGSQTSLRSRGIDDATEHEKGLEAKHRQAAEGDRAGASQAGPPDQATRPQDSHTGPNARLQSEDAEASLKTTSISFATKVTLDSGHQMTLSQRLPKSEATINEEIPSETLEDMVPVPQRSDDSASGSRGRAEESGRQVHLSMDRSPLRYRDEMRNPLLQSNMREVARGSGAASFDNMPSLTSASTASPIAEEVNTPIDMANNRNIVASPMQSPTASQSASRTASGYWPGPRSRDNGSQRSQRSNGSVRRMSRRSSARSGSSQSPASVFLSQWGKAKDEPPMPAQPDDEGQEIGGEGHSGYFIGRQIGYGGFSTVKEVTTLQDDRQIRRAVKIVRKQISGKSEQESEKVQSDFEKEISVWRYLHHPNVLPLIATFDTPFATFCVMQLIESGTLFDVIREMRKPSAHQRGMSMPLAKRYFYQLASAIRYLHEDMQVVHRDIKLENCLLDMSAPNARAEGGNILLCDFGMAEYITNEVVSPSPYSEPREHLMGPTDGSTIVAGSLQYLAPESIKAAVPYTNPTVDIWALGVCLYLFLTAEYPYQSQFEPQLLTLISAGEWDREKVRNVPASKNEVSSAGIDETLALLEGCFEMDPASRWTIADIIDCAWLRSCKDASRDIDSGWSSN